MLYSNEQITIQVMILMAKCNIYYDSQFHRPSDLVYNMSRLQHLFVQSHHAAALPTP